MHWASFSRCYCQNLDTQDCCAGLMSPVAKVHISFLSLSFAMYFDYRIRKKPPVSIHFINSLMLLVYKSHIPGLYLLDYFLGLISLGWRRRSRFQFSLFCIFNIHNRCLGARTGDMGVLQGLGVSLQNGKGRLQTYFFKSLLTP